MSLAPHTLAAPLEGTSPRPDPLGGLSHDEGVAEAEALMMRVAVGPRFARLGVMAQEHLQGGGRRVRARLALAAGEALGMTRARLVPWAAACEMVHNATLIHDDIQDGDRVRRDQPTTWVRHGVGQAINAGDLLLMLPFTTLAELDAYPVTKWRLSEALARAAERTVRGQSSEMDLTSTGRVTWEDWSQAAEGKTGALLALPVEGAAILAGLDATTASRLAAAFCAIGLVYQMSDDLLDLSLDKGHGRVAGDIREGRITSLVAAWCSLHPTEATELLETLRTPSLRSNEEVVARIVRSFHEGGAVALVRERMLRHATAITTHPVLTAIPDLHAVAMELMQRFVATEPLASTTPVQVSS